MKLEFGELLELSWDNYGSLRGSFGVLLRPSWDSLGFFWGP